MNALHRICLSVLGGAAVTGGLITTAYAQDDNILGTWNCGLSFQDPEIGATMNVRFEQTYDADGTYVRAGEMSIAIPALQVDIAVAIDEAGTWRFLESLIVAEKMTKLDLASMSDAPTQMEQMLVEQMRAGAQAELSDEQTVNLKSLTATTMEYEDADGMLTSCQKA